MAPVVPLITCDADGAYRVCEETLAWIAAHRRPFGIVACAGKYRTGKSFLMNVLTNANPGFGVGHTVNRCTRGIWVCKEFFRASETSDHDVLFLDTEGIGAVDADEDTDVKIMTYTLLLSTCFVYNAVGAIDESAIATLSFMSRTAAHLQSTVDESHRGGGSSGGVLASPTFVWLMRDWDLRVECKDGRPLTASEYLEGALRTASVVDGGDLNGGNSDGTDTVGSIPPQRPPQRPPQAVAPRDATRSAILGFFQTRFGRQLPRPSADCRVMDVRSGRGISAAFLNKIKDLRMELLTSTAPVLQYGTKGGAVSGASYAELVRTVVRSAEERTLPRMGDAWEALMRGKVAEATEAAVSDAALRLASLSEDSPEAAWVEVVDRSVTMFRARMAPTVDAHSEGRVRERAEKLLDAHLAKRRAEADKARTAAFDAVETAFVSADTATAYDEDDETLRGVVESMRNAVRCATSPLLSHQGRERRHAAGLIETVGTWMERLERHLDTRSDRRTTMRAEREERASTLEQELEVAKARLQEADLRADALVAASLSRATLASDTGGGGEDDAEERGEGAEDADRAAAKTTRGSQEEQGGYDSDALEEAVRSQNEANVRAERAESALTTLQREMSRLEDALVAEAVTGVQTSTTLASECTRRLQVASDRTSQLQGRVDALVAEGEASTTNAAALKLTLEELAARESQARAEGHDTMLRFMAERQHRDDAHHAERLRLHEACSRTTAVLETRNAELRYAKRSREAADEMRQECKRLRAEAIVRYGELCRTESEATHARQQIIEARREGDLLRQSVHAMQRQIDVRARVATATTIATTSGGV